MKILVLQHARIEHPGSFRRFLKKDNHKLTINDICFKKPGNGIPASMYKQVLGKRIKKNFKEDQKIMWRNLL